MIKQNDRVRLLDNNEVIEGIVSSLFESNGVDYIQIHGGGVYTTDEVTKVPQSPVSASNVHLEPQEAPSVDTEEVEEQEEPAAYPEADEKYDFDKDDRPDEYKQENDMPAITPLLEQIDTMRNTINQMVAYLELSDDKQAKEYLEMLRGVSDEL